MSKLRKSPLFVACLINIFFVTSVFAGNDSSNKEFKSKFVMKQNIEQLALSLLNNYYSEALDKAIVVGLLAQAGYSKAEIKEKISSLSILQISQLASKVQTVDFKKGGGTDIDAVTIAYIAIGILMLYLLISWLISDLKEM